VREEIREAARRKPRVDDRPPDVLAGGEAKDVAAVEEIGVTAHRVGDDDVRHSPRWSERNPLLRGERCGDDEEGENQQ
jgi:hypothetical protein